MKPMSLKIVFWPKRLIKMNQNTNEYFLKIKVINKDRILNLIFKIKKI